MARYDVRKRVGEALHKAGIRELAFVSVGQEGATTAARILTSALAREGRYVNTGLDVRGERANSPVLNTIRIGNAASLPTCAAVMPSELLVLNESIYTAQAVKVRKAIQGLAKGTLMVCSHLDPVSIDFPYDFAGTVATSDARRIYLDIVGQVPPRFGTAALGLYVAATGAVSLESLSEAIMEHLSPGVGRKNMEAALMVHKNTKIKEGVKIKGKRSRKQVDIASEEELKDPAVFTAPTLLPGASEGSSFISGDFLPVWSEAKCRCDEDCPLPKSCPEGVITYEVTGSRRKYEVDYEYCKRCGICARECPFGAITMIDVREVMAKKR